MFHSITSHRIINLFSLALIINTLQLKSDVVKKVTEHIDVTNRSQSLWSQQPVLRLQCNASIACSRALFTVGVRCRGDFDAQTYSRTPATHSATALAVTTGAGGATTRSYPTSFSISFTICACVVATFTSLQTLQNVASFTIFFVLCCRV